MSNPNKKELTQSEREELEYLRFFYSECDFGPAHEDVIDSIDQYYTAETGNQLPKGYE